MIMSDKQKVLVHVKDLEKMATLIDDLAWEIDRVSSCGVITYNDLALSMEELMVERPEQCIMNGARKPEIFWTEKRKLARNQRGTD